jgi:hypothetical protein
MTQRSHFQLVNQMLAMTPSPEGAYCLGLSTHALMTGREVTMGQMRQLVDCSAIGDGILLATGWWPAPRRRKKKLSDTDAPKSYHNSAGGRTHRSPKRP